MKTKQVLDISRLRIKTSTKVKLKTINANLPQKKMNPASTRQQCCCNKFLKQENSCENCQHLHLSKVRSTFGVVSREWRSVEYALRVGAACSCERLAVTVLVEGGRSRPAFASSPRLVCAFYARSAACRSAVQLRAGERARARGRRARRIAARWGGLSTLCAWVRTRIYTAIVVVCAANAACSPSTR